MTKNNVLTLSRQTRVYLPLPSADRDEPTTENRWHAIGSIRPWGSYVVIETTVTGQADPYGGYLVDIRTMDQWFIAACREVEQTNPWPSERDNHPWESICRYAEQVWQKLACHYARLSTPQSPLFLSEMRWRFTPHLTMTLHERTDNEGQQPSTTLAPSMTDEQEAAMVASSRQNQCLQTSLTLQYEFAAAHRLHCDLWSDAQNQEVFGKCNHPSGHGHNYLLEVTVRWPVPIPIASQGPRSVSVCDNPPAVINPIVQTHVLQRLDHRFLNVDVAEFRDLNPTVENIAQVVFGWLDAVLPETWQLWSIKIFETAKTWAEVRRE